MGRRSALQDGAPAGRSLIPLASPQGLECLSFYNLVEAHMLVTIRSVCRLSMGRIRRALAWLHDHRQIERSLLHLKTDGRHLLVGGPGGWISASESGQALLSNGFVPRPDGLERDADGLPCRLYPFMGLSGATPRSTAVVIDPTIAFGRPVLNGTRILTAIVAERHAAGEAREALAVDYGLSPETIDEALRYERQQFI